MTERNKKTSDVEVQWLKYFKSSSTGNITTTTVLMDYLYLYLRYIEIKMCRLAML